MGEAWNHGGREYGPESPHDGNGPAIAFAAVVLAVAVTAMYGLKRISRAARRTE